MSVGWGCSGVVWWVVGGWLTPFKDLTGAFFPPLIPILSGHRRRERPAVLTPMRESIVSGRLCYSRMDAGVSAQINRGEAGPRYLQ